MKIRAVFATSLIALLTLTAMLSAHAAPLRQDNLPSPTPDPQENTPYTLETVGGNADPVVFPGVTMDPFTIGDTTVTSLYPDGMAFSVKVESTNGDIQDVILFMTLAQGTGNRQTAEFNSETGEWVARLWEGGSSQPAWTHFDFRWRVRDASGASVDTEPQPIDYWDTIRPWFRMESEHIIGYWFGFGEDDPGAIAQKMADYMANTHQRRVDAFGRPLSYKPVTVVYPSQEALGETTGTGATNTRAAGFTSSELGMSVQTLRGDTYAPGQENCVWSTKPEDWTMERRINTIFSVTTHEIAHLYQYDVLGGPLGPEWWQEGLPDFMAYTAGNYEERLRNLATLQDIPSLLTEVGWRFNQADGCYALSYDMGVSFINFLYNNYGGIEAIRQMNEMMRGEGLSVYAATEKLTGKAFLDIENEWRIYLGYQPLSLADIDPAAALEPPIDTTIQAGDTITLPAAPFAVNIYENPGPNQLGNGQCFANTPVTILNVGSLDGVDYYQIDCMGMQGWMTRDELVGPGN